MKYLNWDFTIQQRGRLWKDRWKIDFASFRTFSRLSQVAQKIYVAAEEKELPPSSDGDGRTYRLAVSVLKWT